MIKIFSQLLIATVLLSTTTGCRAAKPELNDLAYEAPVIVTQHVQLKKDFHSLEVSGIINVELKQGPMKVEIKGTKSDIACTRFENKHGELSISYDSSKRLGEGSKSHSVTVFVSMPDVRSLDFSGATSLKVVGDLECDKLDIDGSGASSLIFGVVRATKVYADLMGACSFDCKSIDTGDCDLECSGAVSVDIGKLTCIDLELDCSGAGNIDIDGIKCNDIECDVSGAANVTLSGTCTDAELEASGASHLKITQLKVERKKDISKSGMAKIKQ